MIYKNRSLKLSDWGDSPPANGFTINGRDYLDVCKGFKQQTETFPEDDWFMLVTQNCPRIPGTDPDSENIWGIRSSRGLKETRFSGTLAPVKASGFEIK